MRAPVCSVSCVCAVGQRQGVRELCRMRNDHTHVGFYLGPSAQSDSLGSQCSLLRAHDTHDTHTTRRRRDTRDDDVAEDTLPFSTGLHEHWFPVHDAPAAPYEERLHAAPEGTAAHDERPAQQARLPDRLVVQRQRKSFRELRHRHVHRPAWSAGAAVRRRRRTTPSRQWPSRSVGWAARSLRGAKAHIKWRPMAAS